MAQNELEIILKLVDQASAGLKSSISDIQTKISELKNFNQSAYDDMSQAVEKFGKSNEIVKGNVKNLSEQVKEASKELKNFRQTLFIVTAAAALAIKSVNDLICSSFGRR